jgi:hypothetical protein
MTFHHSYKRPSAATTAIALNSSPIRGESIDRKRPSPHEDSDSSKDVRPPVVLHQVLADLVRFTEELGPNHVKVAETWNSLGLIRLHMQQNVNAAVKCHKEALVIYRFNADALTLDIAVTLADLGRCYERLNDCTQALQKYQEAVDLMQNDPSIRQNHSVVESVRRSMARLRRE